MIKSFADRRTHELYVSGKSGQFPVEIARRATRKLEYIDGARSLGANDWRMISKHVIPNSITPLLTTAILDLGTIPLSIAALSFLGIGLPDGYTDWGQIMNYARSWLDGPYWYVTVFPAAFIILFSLGWNLFGDAVRDAFDPRTR